MHKILIVDDIPANLITLKAIIKAHFKNVEVIEASDAKKALTIAISTEIDLIISDIQMPEIDGFLFARYLKKTPKTENIPLIFLTAIFNSDEYKAKGFEIGAIDYLIKPINEVLFVPKLKTYLENIKLQKDLKKQLAIVKQQNKTIEEQSRFAAMGEMISMIAHQWRQPLSTMAGLMANIELRRKMNMLTDEYFDETLTKHNEKLQYLSQTIEDFMGFFRNSGTNETITVNHLLDSSIRLMSDAYKSSFATIELINNIDENMTISTLPSKFNQVMLNLLKNSLDEYKSKNIENSKTTITINSDENNLIIIVEDNAGGIPQDILANIWDAYFSTKDKNGTGIGLYMSKILVEQHLNGTINASNNNNGAVFTITLPLKIQG
jgi:signal transduction histidine kinase